MRKFYEEHINGFHLVEAKKIWDAYTKDYFMMDTYYREFHEAFASSLDVSNNVLGDKFKQVAEVVENEYKNWYLADLASNWTNIVANELSIFISLVIGCLKVTEIRRNSCHSLYTGLLI